MSQNKIQPPDVTSESTANVLPLWKKLLFAVLATVLFFALAEGLLAVLGIDSKGYESDPYVGFSGSSPLFVETTDAKGIPAMERAPGKKVLFNQQSFPVRKPDGAYRIFCVGGSTTYGRPYGDVTSFCGWLREFLAAAEPERRWEVINAGGISYASYRVTVLMEELIRYDPDLFVVYSGHNEFLERRTYPQIIAMPKPVRGMGALASKTRTWAAVGRLIAATKDAGTRDAGTDVLSSEVVTLLDDAVGLEAYSRDDELAEKVLQHYRFNLARMVDIAHSVEADVLMVTPASNLHHATPFKSEHREGFSAEKRARWEALIAQGIAAYRRGDPGMAAIRFQQAVELDSRHAGTQFLLAQSLYAVGRFDDARTAFERARDDDVCPLRALSPMAQFVRETVGDRDLMLVDFEGLVEQRSDHGIPGNSLFLDHVHPTIEGNRLLALTIVDTLVNGGIVTPVAKWREERVAEVVARVVGGLDSTDHARALTNLAKVLGWAGKQQEAYQLALRAVELDPNDVQVQYHAGLTADLLGRYDEAMAHYRRAIEILPTADLPHGNLAVGLEREQKIEEALTHYRIAFRESSPEMYQHHRENLANMLVKQGYVAYGARRFDEALALLSEADEVRPDDPTTLGRLGVVLMASGRTDDAVARLGTAVALRPDDAGAHNRLALAMALAGRPAEAAETYARALELDPAVVDAPDNLFTVLNRMGRTRDAEEIRGLLGR